MRSREQKNERARFKRGKSSLFIKGHDLHVFHNLSVYILTEAEGKYAQYSTYGGEGGPPPKSKLNGALANSHRRYEFAHSSDQQSDIDRALKRAFNAARALHVKCNARVYLLVSNGKGFLSHTYPENVKHWPPPKTILKKWFPAMERRDPSSYVGGGDCPFQFSHAPTPNGQVEAPNMASSQQGLEHLDAGEFQAEFLVDDDDEYQGLAPLQGFLETTS
ncbi:uncharacterized protein GIQ15_03618 [Arthroderma uncinatum]|uniref:uncharacterized protein n=1 Tax=Arthroderma uncinatum TaxID=74035 RepID=UPI00144A7F75|nr:uncharacterized protein GIQ15_03618 [Arthroderma uncinatum]KAF3484294.1 hypothetical protein GIQ15_03618 [Arthroderma uncinatum]